MKLRVEGFLFGLIPALLFFLSTFWATIVISDFQDQLEQNIRSEHETEEAYEHLTGDYNTSILAMNLVFGGDNEAWAEFNASQANINSDLELIEADNLGDFAAVHTAVQRYNQSLNAPVVGGFFQYQNLNAQLRLARDAHLSMINRALELLGDESINQTIRYALIDFVNDGEIIFTK